ncbi:hypothetical protein V1264_011288 [Littorina saxatilis]
MFVAQSQYLYRRVASTYTDDLTSLENITSDDTCGAAHVNTSSEEYKIYAKISEETASWTMYLNLCGGIPPIFTILILGAYSDQVGRRFLFLVSISGAAVKGVLMSVIIFFDLHVVFLLLGDFVEGVTGGYASLTIASFSYTSDMHTPEMEMKAMDRRTSHVNKDGSIRGKSKVTGLYDASQPTQNGAEDNPAFESEIKAHQTNKKTHSAEDTATTATDTPAYDSNRAVRVLAIECFHTASAGVIQLTNGYFIAYAGFFYVILTGTLILIIDLVFTWFAIQNAESQVRKKGSILAPLKIVVRAIRQPRKLVAFIMCNLAIMLIVLGDGGLIRTMPIYQMSPPFCWSSVQIGWFNSEFYFATLLAVPFLLLLKCWGLSEPTMAGIGTTINALGTAIYALANVYSWVFYIVAVMTVPGMLAYAFTRTITSRLAGPEAVGAMFAFTSLVEQTMWLIGSVTGSAVYLDTVSKLHSAVFIYFASVYFLAALIYFFEGCVERRLSPFSEDPENIEADSGANPEAVLAEDETKEVRL